LDSVCDDRWTDHAFSRWKVKAIYEFVILEESAEDMIKPFGIIAVEIMRNRGVKGISIYLLESRGNPISRYPIGIKVLSR